MENNVNRRSKVVRIIGIIGALLLLIAICLSLGYWWSQSHAGDDIDDKKKVAVSEIIVSKLAADDVYNQHASNISSTTERIKIAFTGDQGDSDETRLGLKMIRDEGAEALVVLGDFEYKDNPSLWLKNFDEYLGKYFPVIAVAGNHEEKAWSGYAKVVQQKIDQLPKGTCISETKEDIGLTYDCTIGPVHIAFVTPDIQIKHSLLRNPTLAIRNAFKKELASKTFMQESVANEEKNVEVKDPWRVCAWHKVHSLMQLGTKSDNITWDIYEECRRFGAYIFAGHDHVYARSKTVLNFPGMIVSSSTESEVIVKPNSTGVAILGLGGMSIRPRERQGDTWWASTYTLEKLKIESDNKKTNIAGIMFCTFDKQKDAVPCYFKTTDGRVRDEFVMKR